MDTTNGKTETIRGKQEGVVSPDVVSGELIIWCGLLGPWVRGHGQGWHWDTHRCQASTLMWHSMAPSG